MSNQLIVFLVLFSAILFYNNRLLKTVGEQVEKSGFVSRKQFIKFLGIMLFSFFMTVLAYELSFTN